VINSSAWKRSATPREGDRDLQPETSSRGEYRGQIIKAGRKILTGQQ